jgi:plastocyanin
MAAHRSANASGRRFLVSTIAIACLVMLTIATASASTVTVEAANFQFKPASRSVNVGDVVRWTFAGDPHSVTSGAPGAPDGQFDSGIVDPGGSFQVTFDTAGTYRYFCQIHPEQMTGTVVVRAGSSPSPTPRPTAKPTPRPTVKPTAKPTARPTARPTASATATASASSTATAAPTASPSTSAASPSASAVPTASASAETSQETPSASPTAPATPGSAAAVDPLAIVLGVIVLVLLAAGALILARRGRSA